MSLDPRRISIFRPYADEVPWELPPEERELTRVAKVDDAVIGVYRLRRLEPTVFEISTLHVEPAHRGAGLGRWLLGHALGLAESKGGRTVFVTGGRAEALFKGYGFVVDSEDRLRFDVTPE